MDKTLKTVQTVCKVCKIFAEIAFVMLVVIASVCAFAAIGIGEANGESQLGADFRDDALHLGPRNLHFIGRELGLVLHHNLVDGRVLGELTRLAAGAVRRGTVERVLAGATARIAVGEHPFGRLVVRPRHRNPRL